MSITCVLINVINVICALISMLYVCVNGTSIIVLSIRLLEIYEFVNDMIY